MYVAADADLDRARSEGAVRACFSSAGQLCISVERLLVHEDVADEFLAAFVRAVRAMRLGAGLGYGADMGASAPPAQLRAGHRARRGRPRPRARTVLAGGRHRPDIGPLLLRADRARGRHRRHGCRDEETFGPVVSVYRVAQRRGGGRPGQRQRLRPQRLVWTRDVGARAPAGRRGCRPARSTSTRATPRPGRSIAAPMGGMKSSGLSAAGTAPRASTSTPSPRTSRPSAWSASPRRPRMSPTSSGPDALTLALTTPEARWASGDAATGFDHDVVVVGSGLRWLGRRAAAGREGLRRPRLRVRAAGSRTRTSPGRPGTCAATSGRRGWAASASSGSTGCPTSCCWPAPGVGGGSLNYANTLYVPPAAFFRDPQWRDITDWQAELAPHYDDGLADARRGRPTRATGPVEQVMRQAADDLGVGDTFRKTPVGVFFGDAAASGCPTPTSAATGPTRTGCTECGNCMVGCRVGAKNTLVKNYLALAERRGVTIEPLRTVRRVRPLDPARPERGYAVTTEATGAWLRERPAHRHGRRRWSWPAARGAPSSCCTRMRRPGRAAARCRPGSAS